MATRSSVSYQQPPYQSTVNEPVVVQPVVVVQPAATGTEDDDEDPSLGVYTFCIGFIGIALLVISVYVYETTDDRYRLRYYGTIGLPIMIIVGISFSICACCCCFVLYGDKKNVPESSENAQPVSEPFTQPQMNQGSPSTMYVPVQSVSENPYYDNTPSASNSGNMSTVQQPFQYGAHTTTGSTQNSGNNKYNKHNLSQICRQWNEGTCTFGEMCRHQHFCIECADSGKMYEKHKASSEECPNKGSTPQNSGPEYDQQPDFAPPPYSSLEGPNTASAPQYSSSDIPLFAPPPYKES